MKSLWNAKEAARIKNDPLKLRVYTSQLLGKEPGLVLHGGGNTSVKMNVRNLFGEEEDVLYVKGSGWDLATIAEEGFAPVRMATLLKMAELPTLSDTEMVRNQRAAMINPYAPNPSVEAILHAVIPFTYVDHTHADAVVTVTNTCDGKKRVQDIYGNRVLIVPYVMPGFILARKIYEMTRNIDWASMEGMILLNHGVFTFHDDPRVSYEKMIGLVDEAENYLRKQKVVVSFAGIKPKEDLQSLAEIRKRVSTVRGKPQLALLNAGQMSTGFSKTDNLKKIAGQGPLTPDHIIRTKRIPVIVGRSIEQDIVRYAEQYRQYFTDYTDGSQQCLDSAPRWAVWPEHGTIAFGSSIKELKIIQDITAHTIQAILSAEKLGGWKALSPKDLFEMEYWELEQAKLKKAQAQLPFQGKVVLVTGAASGIGRACVEEFLHQGAVMAAVDIDKNIEKIFSSDERVLGLVCDLTHRTNVKEIVEQCVRRFGGLDIVVSNAGIFPASEPIQDINQKTWEKSLAVNLSGHQIVLTETIPYLTLGINPNIVVVGSKNVPAPGPGVSAYSAAKAGLTQLARVAALELASSGIRVNIIHPNQVFDTAIWTDDVLTKRAKHYNVTIDEYKKSNLLKTEITSADVARLVCSIAGENFSKTTGAQIPIDGGNERVI